MKDAIVKTGNFPPGPPPVGGHTLQQFLYFRDFLQDPLGKVMGWMAEYGDVWHYMSGRVHQYSIANPDMIHEILVRQAPRFIKGPVYTSERHGLARFMGKGLVTSNGEFWKRQRRLVAPAFHTSRITAYADTMVNYTLKRLERWRDGEVLDIDDEMMQLTLLIVGRTLFDADTSTTVNHVKRAVEVVQKASNTPTLLPYWAPTPLRIRSYLANQTLDKIVYKFIEDRRLTGEDRGDLLSMLLLSEDENGERMTDKQARDEAVTLILAGHETTANALNWTWWFLAQHPNVEAALHRELDEVLDGRPPTLDDLRRLRYTEMVIKESMRLMPPVWNISRMNLEATEVMGYTFPPQTGSQILIYCLHRNPAIWDKPNDFIPERWADDSLEDLHRYAYLPFGGGPRICIGNGFALMEANLLLATIAQGCRLHLTEGAKIVPQPYITMYPRNGLPMRVEARVPQRQSKMSAAAL